MLRVQLIGVMIHKYKNRGIVMHFSPIATNDIRRKRKVIQRRKLPKMAKNSALLHNWSLDCAPGATSWILESLLYLENVLFCGQQIGRNKVFR
jgi:hypothetical protein